MTISVPNVRETLSYYSDFGLIRELDGWFRTIDGGRQLRIVHAPTRRLIELEIGADDDDDVGRVAADLRRIGVHVSRQPHRLTAREEATGLLTTVTVSSRLCRQAVPAFACNEPGRQQRKGKRAPGVLRSGPVRPLKLGHVVVGTTDFEATRRSFAAGLGFKVSDLIAGRGVFLRCSSDHHNVLILSVPVSFLHHTSWQVSDIDEVGRGATPMLQADPGRQGAVQLGTRPAALGYRSRRPGALIAGAHSGP